MGVPMSPTPNRATQGRVGEFFWGVIIGVVMVFSGIANNSMKSSDLA
jgi:hypothetical protein